MASEIMHERFRDACETRAESYPASLLRTTRPHQVHAINAHHSYLSEKKEELFDGDEESVVFMETAGGGKGFREDEEMTSTGAVMRHLLRPGREPMIRHVFLRSADSRSPLRCSSLTFKSMCTYMQTEPQFLDALYAFGDQKDPKDVCLSNVHIEDTSRHSEEQLIKISGLGRSGHEIRCSLLLRSAEISEWDPEWPWQIRQAAINARFDMGTGAATWITIKGNDVFRNKIKEAQRYLNLPKQRPAPGKEMLHVGQHFRAFLDTYLIYLTWCDENWRAYVNAADDISRPILERARNAPIDDHLGSAGCTEELASFPPRFSRAQTMTPKTTPALNGAPSWVQIARRSTLSVITGAARRLGGSQGTRQSDVEARAGLGLPLRDALKRESENSRPARIEVNVEKELDDFRLHELQSLHSFSDRFSKASLTIQLNIRVIKDIDDYFGGLGQNEGDSECFVQLRSACVSDIKDFQKELRGLIRRLESRQTQLQMLEDQLSKGVSLYDGILQYRALHISRKFSDLAQETADQSRALTEKTAVQTTSMHVITIVTLIFLPATFVATFFQSGVFLWNENAADEMTEPFRLLPENIALFSYVCVPIMILTIGSWLLLVYGSWGLRASGFTAKIAKGVARAPFRAAGRLFSHVKWSSCWA
ncbi:hypothetical protein RB595_002306 [Gaeumannomyces hyphopodioides]